MKWIYGIGAVVAVIILMGLFEKVQAQELPKEWTPSFKSKPIQCAPLKQIAKLSDSKQLRIVWSGVGIGVSENIGVQRVDLFLSVNPDTSEWLLTEIGPDKTQGCMIGFGTGFGIDADTMKLFSKKES
jgi:hypothetical protein